jgi:hypothetical protein
MELAQDLLEHAQRVNERLIDASRSEVAQIRLGGVDSFSATVGPILVQAIAKGARQISSVVGTDAHSFGTAATT